MAAGSALLRAGLTGVPDAFVVSGLRSGAASQGNGSDPGDARVVVLVLTISVLGTFVGVPAYTRCPEPRPVPAPLRVLRGHPRRHICCFRRAGGGHGASSPSMTERSHRSASRPVRRGSPASGDPAWRRSCCRSACVMGLLSQPSGSPQPEWWASPDSGRVITKAWRPCSRPDVECIRIGGYPSVPRPVPRAVAACAAPAVPASVGAVAYVLFGNSFQVARSAARSMREADRSNPGRHRNTRAASPRHPCAHRPVPTGSGGHSDRSDSGLRGFASAAGRRPRCESEPAGHRRLAISGRG